MIAHIEEPDFKKIHTDIEKYQYILEQHTQDAAQTIAVHLTLGKLYERAGDTAEAIQEFAHVALLYADQGHLLKAMAAAQLIVRLDPDNEEVLERLRELYFQKRTVPDTQLQEFQESMQNIEALQGVPQEADEGQSDVLDEEGNADAQADGANLNVVALLRQIPLFTRLSVSEVRGVRENSELRQFAAGETVLSAGNVRRSLFVILQGSVKILGKDKDLREVFLASLPAGISFGEFALFGRIDTNLSVIAEQASALIEIPRELVLKLAKVRPHVTEALKTLYRGRILDTALARVPLFSQLTPQDRQKIVKRFKPVKAKKRVTLMREGEPGRSMYFLLSGKVGVYTVLEITAPMSESGAVDTENLRLATLRSGDFFGEQALVTSEPRSATVIAESDVLMLRLMKNDLAALVEKYPGIESALQIETFQKRMKTKFSLLQQFVHES